MRQHPRYATYLVVSFLVKRQMGNRAGVCVCVCVKGTGVTMCQQLSSLIMLRRDGSLNLLARVRLLLGDNMCDRFWPGWLTTPWSSS